MPAAGYRNNSNGALNNVGSNGNYWSSTWNSNTNSYNLNFNSSNVNPGNNNNRANGFSVRCVSEFINKPSCKSLVWFAGTIKQLTINN
jgi:uncharacterized protein (TIGR02145 family)